MERNRGGRPRHPDVLTPAEWRVLDALREGGTNAEIAERLGLSADTVKTHISNMLAKLELRDRRALVAWRPDAPRRRLGGVQAVPAALWSGGRPLAWVGVGAAALAGVAVGTRASFSPDGKTIVFVLDSAVAYLIDVESVSQRPLLERAVREGWSEGAIFIENAYRGPGILVRTFYSRGADDSDDVRAWESSWENRYFTWSGEPLPGREEPFWTTCDGHLSPNGGHTARSVGDYISTVHGRDFIPREPPWPSIVIADAETCAPLFRVQSALPAHNSGLQGYYSAEWAGSWLPDSSGYVVQVANGYATVRTSGNPALLGLPSGRGAPFTAPAGDGRYFLYGWDGVWDSLEDSWTAPPAGGVSWQGFSWGGDETEVRYVAVDGYWGDFGFNWLLLPPKIEFPPFSDEIAFRVRGSGNGCIDLTGDQQTDTAVAGCIPGGARLTLAVPDNPPQQDCGFTCYPSVRGGPGHWSVYVRTEDGLEGWITLDSLEHD